MTAILLPNGKQQYFTTAGLPAVGYKVATFAAGTSTPQTTWQDALKVATNTNPIILDGRGEASIFWDGAYKVQLQDSTGAVIWTQDNLQSQQNSLSVSLVPAVTNSIDLGSASLSWRNLYLGANNAPVLDSVSGNIGYIARTAAESAASVTPVNFFYPSGHWFRYGADPTGVADATTAINNALKVSAGALSYGPKGTYKVTSTLRLQDNSELYMEPLCQINYTDTTPGTFCMQVGALGAGGGESTVENLQIILQTKTAGGFDFINSKNTRLIKPYVQGYTTVIDTTRTNIGFRWRGDAGIISFWNTLIDPYSNNCHTAFQFVNTGVNQITKQFFVNVRAWGGSTQGDTTSIAFDIQSYNGAYSSVDQGYIDGFGTYFNIRGIAQGWRVRAVNIDSESITTVTPNGVIFGATTSDCKFDDCLLSNAAQILDFSPANSGNQFNWNMTAPKIGSSFASAAQNYAGLNDHTGQLGAQALCMTGNLFVVINGGTIQTLQGACYVPSTGLIFAASKQGNLLWFNPTSYYEVRGSLNYTSTLSNNDRIPICYCPFNGLIYIANRADNKLVSVNPKTFAIVQQIDLTVTAGANCAPYGIAYCPANQKIYVAENGTNNLSIITPTTNGLDSVTQTLGGFGIALLTVAYCPITQKMYVGGQNANLFIVTPTGGSTDSIAQTLGLTGSNFYGIAYCHRNQKMYVAAGNVASLNVVNPTTGGTDTVIQTVTLTAGGNTSAATRAAVYDVAADALLLLGGNSRCAVVYPSQAGTADLVTNVQVTAGTGVDLVYHPNAGKVYECNASNLYEYA